MAFVIYKVSARPAGATYAKLEFMDHSVEDIPVSWIITTDYKKTDWPDLPALQFVTESYPQVLVSMTYSSTCQVDVSIIKTPFPCHPYPCLYIYRWGLPKYYHRLRPCLCYFGFSMSSNYMFDFHISNLGTFSLEHVGKIMADIICYCNYYFMCQPLSHLHVLR